MNSPGSPGRNTKGNKALGTLSHILSHCITVSWTPLDAKNYNGNWGNRETVTAVQELMAAGQPEMLLIE